MLPDLTHEGKVMPAVPYYLGHTAQAWIAAMSGPARAATENVCTATSLATGTFPASPRPAEPTAQRQMQEEAGRAAAAATAGAWEAWASHWFTPRTSVSPAGSPPPGGSMPLTALTAVTAPQRT